MSRLAASEWTDDERLKWMAARASRYPFWVVVRWGPLLNPEKLQHEWGTDARFMYMPFRLRCTAWAFETRAEADRLAGRAGPHLHRRGEGVILPYDIRG